MPTHARAVSGSVTVPHEGHGVSLARHALSAELVSAGVPDDVRQDALLVLSELVSNAVKHGAPMLDGAVRVSWATSAEHLHLEITDGGALTRPNPAVATVFSLGGRGLDIVRTISREWGVTDEADSVTVWADVPHVRKKIGDTVAGGPGH